MAIKTHEPRDEDYQGKKVITVRIGYELYEHLKDQSHEYRTSMNRHCVNLLRQQLKTTENQETEKAT